MWEERLFDEVVGRYGEPAYVRRGRAVEHALFDLIEHCHDRRDELLKMVRTRLALLHARAGEWAVLSPLLRDEGQVRILADLHASLAPRLRGEVARTRSHRALALALRELKASVERFNRRWREYLPTVELSQVNELRENYNRYYLLEKECATHSVSVARQGYRPLEPLTHDELARRIPPLPVPQLTE